MNKHVERVKAIFINTKSGKEETCKKNTPQNTIIDFLQEMQGKPNRRIANSPLQK
ncbi:hypothetical protein [uncultured Bacteroides sp.]|uniref:hypothetical protein n=1 Tax=uncultured Bacteroides sp. TaxID=162156 RepID=UPI0026354F1E|nr:hypothetical protein [uncultured Bacteroides sp.]